MKLPVLTFLLVLVVSAFSHAEDTFMESGPLGETDWINGYIEATGQGTSRYTGNRIQEELMAKQAARTVAQARLLEIVKGIRLTGLTTLGVQAQGDTRAATRIKGTLRGARLMNEKITWHKDKAARRGEVVMAEVTLRLCVSPRCNFTKENLTQASLNLPSQKNNKPAETKKIGHSAVIIDLEQALYLPALAPEIINEEHQTLYSQDTPQEGTDLTKGLVHYAKSVEQAKALEIAGPSPLVLKAKEITADNRIMLSNQDGQQFTQSAAIKHGHVIVALD